MRATGIVRRLDDLGRLVIPKEICRVLGWGECEPIELYLDKENRTVVLKRYRDEEKEKMKKYMVEIKMTTSVMAQDKKEAVAKACDVVDLDYAYDWEIDAAEVEEKEE